MKDYDSSKVRDLKCACITIQSYIIPMSTRFARLPNNILHSSYIAQLLNGIFDWIYSHPKFTVFYSCLPNWSLQLELLLLIRVHMCMWELVV